MRPSLMPNLWLFCAMLTASCNAVIGADAPVIEEPTNAAGASGDSGASAASSASGASGNVDVPVGDAHAPLCGDGLIEGDEQCDDGNETAGDGCEACEVRCGPAPEVLEVDTGHCYRFGSAAEAKTWDTARTACEAWGGELVAVTNINELSALQNRLQMDAWVGARIDPATGTFKWTNGERFEANPWTEPLAEGEGDCAAFASDTLVLARFPCDAALGYVCERAPAGVRPE